MTCSLDLAHGRACPPIACQDIPFGLLTDRSQPRLRRIMYPHIYPTEPVHECIFIYGLVVVVTFFYCSL
jgi:hypothetical protein